MHPAIMWWKSRRMSECGSQASAGCGSGGGHGDRASGGGGWEAAGGDWGGDFGGGAFGVRRPLRFLAHKLQLNQSQVTELARILDELKTERAQAEVDQRRTITAFADAVEGEAFNEARAGEGATLRVRTAERLRDAVVAALRKMHALLDAEQRRTLAYLVRTGVVIV